MTTHLNQAVVRAVIGTTGAMLLATMCLVGAVAPGNDKPAVSSLSLRAA